jgi:hypothetical protein
MILGALADVGGRDYLAAQAETNPSAFLSLLGKLLPTEVTGRHAGPIEVALSDLEVARRLAFLLARGAHALDCPQPDGEGIGAAVDSSIRHRARGLNSLTTSAP